MAENEIPINPIPLFGIEHFYRVSDIGFFLDNESGELNADMLDRDFKEQNLLESKERALTYFMELVTDLLLQGKYILPYRGEVDWEKCKPEAHKITLSLIKLHPDGTEEDFLLIGGTEEGMADARMEEQITFVIHRKSGMFL